MPARGVHCEMPATSQRLHCLHQRIAQAMRQRTTEELRTWSVRSIRRIVTMVLWAKNMLRRRRWRAPMFSIH